MYRKLLLITLIAFGVTSQTHTMSWLPTKQAALSWLGAKAGQAQQLIAKTKQSNPALFYGGIAAAAVLAAGYIAKKLVARESIVNNSEIDSYRLPTGTGSYIPLGKIHKEKPQFMGQYASFPDDVLFIQASNVAPIIHIVNDYERETSMPISTPTHVIDPSTLEYDAFGGTIVK